MIAFRDIAEGHALPKLRIELTPSLIVAGAMATNDYENVHHDKAAAQARGVPDIFMNILTSNGHVQRYVTDWAGPQARIRSVALKLGAPNFAGDAMTLSGAVVAKSEADGEGLVEVRVSGTNGLGEHVSATVRLSLPAETGA